ncbi:MAG: hypothetical protein ACOYVJ_03190 [Nitrospirota bacterium]
MPRRKELREKFLRDFDPAERLFFLKKAKEAVFGKGYRASEDLFDYCYYLTLQERFRGISPDRNNGVLRFLLVEGKKEMEEAIKTHEARLEESKLPLPDVHGQQFIEYFSE